VKVVGDSVDEDEQRYLNAMDMELLPANKILFQAYSHHSSSSSLNSPPLLSRPASSNSFSDSYSELLNDKPKSR
jgi:hypothetical protein